MHSESKETMAILACECGCNFFRETVYGGVYCMDKCPRCGGKELKMVERDVTKVWTLRTIPRR